MPTAKSDGARFNFAVSGNPGAPVLVLLNSLGSNMHMWDKVLPAFQSKYRVLRFDMRGHGETRVSPEPFALEQLGHDVLHLLDEIDAQRASICGLSLGGLVAIWLGIHEPKRVDRLVFANTAARIGSPEMWEQRIASVRNTGMSALAAATLERWFTPAYRTRHPEEMDRICEMIAATNPAGYAACCAVLRDVDLRTEVEAVSAPSLVIAGAHDPATPPADGLALHAAIRSSSYIELNASHMSAWECAEEFAGAALYHLTAGESKHG